MCEVSLEDRDSGSTSTKVNSNGTKRQQAATLPAEPLERSKRSRKLSERGMMAANQPSSSDEETDENSEAEESEDEYAVKSAPSGQISVGASQASRGGLKVVLGGNRKRVKIEDESEGAEDRQSSVFPRLITLSPIATPATITRTFVWDVTLGRLRPLASDPPDTDLETLTFPPQSYLGDISPADFDRSNEFTKAQACVPSCGHRLYGGKRPIKIRRHIVGCAKRRAVFEEKDEADPLARLFELQLEAQGKPLTADGAIPVDQSVLAPPSTTPDFATSTFDTPASRLRAAPRARRTAEGAPSSSPPSPTQSSGRQNQPKFFDAATGRALRINPKIAVEQKSLLRVIIHDEIDLIPTIKLHPPAPAKSPSLPPPRDVRPSTVSHMSAPGGSTLSKYTYSLPAAKIWNGTGISVELDELEVHIEEPQRFLLGHEGGEVLLRVRGNDVGWALFYAG